MSLTRQSAKLPATLADAIRTHRAGLLVSAVCAVIGAACSLAPYIAVYAVTITLFVRDDPAKIPVIALWTAAALVVRAVANGAATHVGHVTAYRVLRDLRLALAHKLQRMPLGAVQSRSSGEMRKLLHDDVEQIEEALAHGIPDGAAAAAVPVTTTIVLFAVDWRLALVALLSLVLLVAVSGIGMALAKKNDRALTEHSLVLNKTVMGYLQGIKVIRSYLRVDCDYDRARDAVARGAELHDAAASGPELWLVAAMNVATALAVALLLPTAGLDLVSGEVDLGTAVLFLILGPAYLTPVISLVATLATILVRIQFSAGAVRELLAEDELPESNEPRLPDRFDVEFDGVVFGYRDDQVTIDGVDLRIPEGSKTALVGATGSGKSTLARLLARFYDCREGSIQIGGVDVRDIAPTDLARLVAFIQQDEYIFEASLLENIRIARPDASDAEVERAGRHAQLDEFVERLPEGWRTGLGAGGTDLSGGQRQRIAVARALLKDAPIIVLDEATASLDAATERRTLAALAELTRDRTVIAIAHRLSTIAGSDSIAFLASGRIEAEGRHEQLLDRHPPYRALWDAYTRSAGWRLESAARPARGASPQDEPEGGIGSAEDASAIHAIGAQDAEGGDGHPAGAAGTESTAQKTDVGSMGFLRQWRTLYGDCWRPLLRRGLIRLVIESMFRGAPLIAVLVVVLAAIGAMPDLPLSSSLIWTATGCLIIALSARIVANAWSNHLVWHLAAHAKADLQLSILDRLRRVPLGFFQRIDNGRLSTLITSDVPMIDFQNVPQQLMGSVIQPVYALIVLIVVDWRLALAALAGVPVFLTLTVWSDRIYHRVFAELHRARRNATATMLEQARGAAALRSNPGSAMATRYETAVHRLADASTAMSVKATPATALGSIAVESGQVILIAVGSALFTTGSVSAATLLVFLLLSLALYQPIQELNALAGYRRNQQQIAAKIGEIWDAPILTEPSTPALPTGSAIELRDVVFGYRSGEKIEKPEKAEKAEKTLRNVSMRADAGHITALVGTSGSGKSTIANLISRLWDADAGSVRIGGADVRNIGSAGVLRAVTTVFQDVYLFDDTVRFNLALGRPAASDGEIWEALRAAQCDDVVAALPDGLDTVLSDGGADLSGGQRQRLAIARALLKDSPVLILDEAVAAVDPATEDRIQSALSCLAAGRTVLVVAHRLATVRHAHRIVVVDGGTIAGSGTHEELLRSCPEYRRLAEAQGIGSAEFS